MKTVLELTTAVKPSPTFLSRLRLQIKEELGQDVSLELKVDPSIIGGAVISLKGYYFNYSLKKKLEEYFEKHRSNNF